MEQNQPRTKWLNIRMNEEEYQAAEALFRQTDCHCLSDYARKAILGKPVVKRIRNASLDDFMTGMSKLQDDLRAIGNNFNQVVRRLNSLKHFPDIQQWILLNEQDKTRLFRQIDTISNAVIKIHQIWSRD